MAERNKVEQKAPNAVYGHERKSMNKVWLIVIGIDKFYLTEKEKNYYLQAITAGVKFVDLGDKVLGSNFQYMAKDTAFEETKMLGEGKWLCPKGKWHTKGWECTCDITALPNPKKHETT